MRLLLAEDEKALSKALCTILEHNLYTVDAVYNGLDALDYLESGVYDGVILDVMMPKMDGLTVLRRLRERGNAVPVLLLTAKSAIDDKVAGLDSGADDYLTKPFVTKELLARVRAMTRRQGQVREDVLALGDLALDRSACTLSCQGNKLPLTAKEYQILELFFCNRGQTFSAERLMEKLWGFDSEAEVNVVFTYISYLRKKLKLLGSACTIQSVRNVGYRLEEGKSHA